MNGVRIELQVEDSWSQWRVPSPIEVANRRQAFGEAMNHAIANNLSIPQEDRSDNTVLLPEGVDGKRVEHRIAVSGNGEEATIFCAGEAVTTLKGETDFYKFETVVNGKSGMIYIALESHKEFRPVPPQQLIKPSNA